MSATIDIGTGGRLVGVELPGVPSIVIDNQSGIHQAMTHLVDRHSCQRIGFIRGPQQNKEAESRFEAYCAALERAGLTYDDALVLTDLLVEALELLAYKVGMTVGTSSIKDGARWSSWRESALRTIVPPRRWKAATWRWS